MSAAHRRGARRELEAARVLGTRRVQRSRFQRAPDVEAVRLPSGETLQPEVKTRARAPRLVLDALDKARAYLPGAIPVAVISQTGGEAIACLPLRDLARLLGITAAVAGEQLALARPA